MPLFSEQIIQGILVLSAALFIISVALIIYALGRRARRQQDLRALDESRRRLQAIFAALHEGALDYEAARRQASAFLRPAFGLGMERLLIERLKEPADAEASKRLAKDLGYIALWRQNLTLERPAGWKSPVLLLRRTAAKSFTRARSAENLSLIKPGENWQLLYRSLNDVDTDVRRTALHALAAMGEPASFPALIEYVQKAAATAEGPFSERDILTALSSFPLDACRHLLPLLRHVNPRLRYLALETLAQMTAAPHNGLRWLDDAGEGAVVAGLILSPLAGHEDAEIRARAARLLAHVKDGRAAPKLCELLEDEVWFVRLHAVRALAARATSGNLTHLAACLSDAHWRVREAAAQALVHQGAPGVAQVVSFFLSTLDTYAREQIAETLATSGELARMLDRCRANGAGPEFDALKAIGSMGKAGGLQPAIQSLLSSRNAAAIAGLP